MSQDQRRSEDRTNTCVQAFVSSLDDTFELKCIIRDVSPSGCMIVSNSVPDLPDSVQIFPEGFSSPIQARIAWRKAQLAGLHFEPALDAQVCQRMEEQAISATEAYRMDDDGALLLTSKYEPPGYSERLERARRIEAAHRERDSTRRPPELICDQSPDVSVGNAEGHVDKSGILGGDGD